jgi:hypothetical protein
MHKKPKVNLRFPKKTLNLNSCFRLNPKFKLGVKSIIVELFPMPRVVGRCRKKTKKNKKIDIEFEFQFFLKTQASK